MWKAELLRELYLLERGFGKLSCITTGVLCVGVGLLSF